MIRFLFSILLLHICFGYQLQAQTTIQTSIDSIHQSIHSPSKRISALEQRYSESLHTQDKILLLTATADNYFSIEAYEKSYELYLKALEFASNNQDFNELGNLYKNLGKIQLRLGDYEESLAQHIKSKEAYTKANNPSGVLFAEGNIAIIQSNIGPIESAVQTLKRISKIPELNDRNKANTIMTLGNIYLIKLEIPDQAIQHYQKALALAESDRDTILQIMLHQNIAESHLIKKQPDSAFFYNKNSERLLDLIPNLELNSFLHQYYAEIYDLKKDYAQAYIHLKKHQKFKDSLANSATQLKIANLNTAKEIETQKSNVALQKSKIDSLEQEQFIQQLKITILIISLLVVGMIAYWFIKRSRKRIATLKTEQKDTQERLNFSKEKAEKMAVNIINNQNYIADFTEKIKVTLNRINDKRSKQEVSKLLDQVQTYKIIDDNKQEFSAYLNQVNNEYVFKLNTRYPELSKEEQHICVLIYLNLKNKDIANLLNLSLRSIENKRYRIRKKMNLNTADSLQNTLNNL